MLRFSHSLCQFRFRQYGAIIICTIFRFLPHKTLSFVLIRFVSLAQPSLNLVYSDKSVKLRHLLRLALSYCHTQFIFICATSIWPLTVENKAQNKAKHIHNQIFFLCFVFSFVCLFVGVQHQCFLILPLAQNGQCNKKAREKLRERERCLFLHLADCSDPIMGYE